MSSSARGRLPASAALALVLAAPAGASAAEKPYLDSKPVKVRAGYALTLSAGPSDFAAGKGDARADLVKSRRHYTQAHNLENFRAAYSASSKSWKASLSAGFGKRGKIKVRFTPTGRTRKAPYPGRKCHGSHSTYRKGVIKGTIVLKLGGKLKTIRLHRLRGTLTKPGSYSCDSWGGNSGGKPARYVLDSDTNPPESTFGGDYPIDMKGDYLTLSKTHSGAVEERAGYDRQDVDSGISEWHSVTELLSAGSFTANSDLTRATGHGAGSAFGGTLKYSGTATADGTEGKLSGSFFGRLDTGRVIRAEGRKAKMYRPAQ